MHTTLRAVIAVCAVTFCACSASYGPKGGFWRSGGYAEVAIDSLTYQVTYAGLGPEIADRLAIYRSAELTINRAYDYFIVSETRTGQEEMGIIEVTKTVRLYKGSKPVDNPNAYFAREVVSTMGSPPSTD